MAGLGFKDFQVGEVLTSSDVDGYLMQQSVMRFADAGARGSALGTAVGTGVPLAEGMVSYLDDENEVQYFDGTLWRPSRNVVQVAYAVQTTNFTTTSTSLVAITGASVTITPTSTNNNILMLFTANVGVNEADQFASFRFRRDTTDLFESITVLTTGTGTSEVATMAFVEQAQSTSATDYLVRAAVGNNTLTVANSTLIVIEYVP